MNGNESGICARLVILLGPPGAGKGTQAKLLARQLGMCHVASGDLFRQHQGNGTRLGVKAVEYMDQGLLVPDEITIAMVLQKIMSLGGLTGALLDGFPRNLAQAKALDQALLNEGKGIEKVLQIKVPTEETLRRLEGRLVCKQCQAPYQQGRFCPWDTVAAGGSDMCDSCGGELYQRQDDAPRAVDTRILVYRNETEPLVEHYNKAGNLVDIDGVGTVEEVSQRLLRALGD